MRPIPLLVLLCLSAGGCVVAPPSASLAPAPAAAVPDRVPAVAAVPADDPALGLLRRMIEEAHGRRDAAALSQLYVAGPVYEWRGRSIPLTGRRDLERHLRKVWSNRRELRLDLQVAELHVHADRAYEFGSYEETWLEDGERRITEFGRYVTAYLREADGEWRIVRTLGFSHLLAKKAGAE